MRICIIANGYPNKKEPQWGCFEKDQAVALSELGHQVTVMYVDRRYRKHWRKIGVTKFVDNGIKVYGVFLPPLGLFSHRVSLKFHFKVVTWMLDLLYSRFRKENNIPDVIYAHYIWNIAFSSILKEKYHISIVGIEHWSGLTAIRLSSFAEYWGNIAYTNSDKVLAVSKSLQSHIQKHFGVQSVVVNDILGQEFIESKVQTEKPNHFRFISIGSLIYRKGFDILIEAFAKSDLAKKECSVVIIGEGNEKANLQKQIHRLGVSDSVQLVGRKTKKEIINLMHESRVFILSSRAETFGVVCIEALSQGLPNIATICGGPEEYINDSNGLLVPTNDINAMSTAMIKMYNDYNRYDINAIAEGCKQKFAPQIIAQQLTDIFEEVIKK